MPQSSTDNAAPEGAPLTGRPPKRRRQMVRVACEPCRLHKAGCDGRRPECMACEKSGRVCCYEAAEGDTRAVARTKRVLVLERENVTLRQENQELQRRLALESAPSTPSNPPNHPLSFHSTAQALFPSWLSPVEYDLILSHPNSYAYKELPDIATLKSLHARRIQQTLGDVSFGAGHDLPPPRAEASREGPSAVRDGMSLPQLLSHPYTAHRDRRLERVDVEDWCSVSVSSELAGRMIRFYLEIDHPILGHFDPELFIDDLLSRRTNFCSTLLVTSLLFWACHGYSLIDHRALVLKPDLYAETLRLWEQQRGTDSINTVAAGMFVRLACTINGNEDIGLGVIKDMYQMSHRLELYGPVDNNPDVYAKMDDDERKWYRARAHASWGLFNFTTLHSFSYGPPMMYQLPRFAIPGDAYTWPLPEFMGTTLTKLCKMWLILNQVALAYFAGPAGGMAEHISIDFAENQYRRLLEWADLNGPLMKKWDHDAHHQSYMQIMFHTSILELFRPFLGVETPLKTFPRRTVTAGSTYLASTHQLYCQVLIFPIVHPSATFIWWWYGICQAANAAMTTLEDPNSLQMFLLCLLSLYDLSAGFPVMGNAIAGLLRIATRQGTMHKRNARHLYERLRQRPLGAAKGGHTGTGFSIDLSESLRGSKSASVSQLAENFEEMMVDDAAAA